MKKILHLIAVLLFATAFASCDDKEWGDGESSMEHVYYIGFEDWGKFNNKVEYNVKAGEVVDVPIQFHSERTRSYDVTTYYYVGNELERGVSFDIVDEDGKAIEPNEDGAFEVKWPQAKKGIYNIKVKALGAAKGKFTLYTFDPNAGKIAHPDNITNSKTNDYEVRSFTQNYKVIVYVK